MPGLSDSSELAGIELFRGLEPRQLATINQSLQLRTFAANKSLMIVDLPGDVVYIIREGSVKVHVEQEDGTEVIIALLSEGDVVGEMSGLDKTTRAASVVTIEKTTVLWVAQKPFVEWLKTIPLLSYNLARILAARLRLADKQIQALMAEEVESRVARQIVALDDKYGETAPDGDGRLIPIPLTQSDIAGLIGATRESVNKVIVYFKKCRYISVDRNRITVHNRTALENRF